MTQTHSDIILCLADAEWLHERLSEQIVNMQTWVATRKDAQPVGDRDGQMLLGTIND